MGFQYDPTREPIMPHRRLLTATSVLSVLLLTLHVADDILRGIEPGTLANIGLLPICAVWLTGALLIPERRLGQGILLLGAMLAMAVPYLHMSGRGVGAASRLAGTDGHFFFVWTILALGVCGLFSVVLLVRGVWRTKEGQVR
jgi:hypothetical protein